MLADEHLAFRKGLASHRQRADLSPRELEALQLLTKDRSKADISAMRQGIVHLE